MCRAECVLGRVCAGQFVCWAVCLPLPLPLLCWEPEASTIPIFLPPSQRRCRWRHSYYHGRISRDDAVDRLTSMGVDGSFLLRMSESQEGVYTVSIMCAPPVPSTPMPPPPPLALCPPSLFATLAAIQSCLGLSDSQVVKAVQASLQKPCRLSLCPAQPNSGCFPVRIQQCCTRRAAPTLSLALHGRSSLTALSGASPPCLPFAPPGRIFLSTAPPFTPSPHHTVRPIRPHPPFHRSHAFVQPVPRVCMLSFSKFHVYAT